MPDKFVFLLEAELMGIDGASVVGQRITEVVESRGKLLSLKVKRIDTEEDSTEININDRSQSHPESGRVFWGR